MSNYSAGNAPEGKTSFLVEVTWPGGAAPAPATLEREVLEGIQTAGLLPRDEILFTDRSDIHRAYIVYDHAFEARRTAALDWCAEHGLHTVGRFGRFDYDNSDQCVIEARGLARELLAVVQRG